MDQYGDVVSVERAIIDSIKKFKEAGLTDKEIKIMKDVIKTCNEGT